MRIILSVGTSVFVLLSTIRIGAAIDLNNPHIAFPRVLKNSVREEVITADVKKDPGRTDFDVYMHPVGEIRITTTTFTAPAGYTIATAPPGTVQTTVEHTTIPDVFLFEGCSTCGNEDAAYQLKIYSKRDPTRGEKFYKPILVTQGFDAAYRIPGAQFNFDEFHNILNSVFHKDDTSKELTCKPPPERSPECDPQEVGLLRTLYEEGYDIALLLWKNPLIDIPTNAEVTLQALRWLENHTATGAGTEPVVIGPSMGGLVTRYALQKAGGNFPASGIRARLFIAFDSPNRGAEVPMSIQALASYFSDLDASRYQTFLNLTSTAARQLLLSSVIDRETGDVSQFISDYEDPNDPGNPTAREHGEFMRAINEPTFRANIKDIRHINGVNQKPIYTAAIINGSGEGIDLGYFSQFAHELTYASQSGVKLDLELATANPAVPLPARPVFEGDIVPHNPLGLTCLIGGIKGENCIDKDQLTYFLREPAFVENAPGGLRDTYRKTIKAVQDSGFPWGFVDQRFTTVGSKGNHAFIPSLSGAGLLNRDINNNRSWFTRTGTRGICTISGECMFDEYRAPEKNQRHVAVTQENKQWFLELIRTYGPQGAPLQPIAGRACVLEDQLGVGRLRASFGYNNPNSFSVTIPVGQNNKFAGPGISENEGQPNTFLPGPHNAVFSVTFREIAFPTWTLDGSDVRPAAPDPLRPNCVPLPGPLGSLRVETTP
jgi:hypothetical protein